MSTVSAQTNDELKAQNKSELTPTTKMLLSELPSNIARMEACGNILTQELLDSVSVSDEDPEEAFEKWRIEKRTMMEASPLVECQSKLWRALKAKNNSDYLNIFSVSPKAKQEMGVSYQPSALEQILSQFAPVISANYNPSSGVEAYQGEVQIAVNPNNPLQMVAGANSFYRDPSPVCQSPTGGAANTYGTQALYGSTDGGLTWTYRCAPWNPSVTGGVTGASAWFGSDPAMAWDKQGNAYAVYMLISQNSAGTAAGASIVISKSTDVGNTWTPLGAITTNITSSSTNFDDKEMVAIDNSAGPASTKSHPGRIYVIWDRDNVQRVAYSDNGSTWTEVVLPTPSVGSYDIGGDIKVGPDGTVYAIWNRLVYSGSTQSGERTVFSKSVNGGVTWSTPLVIASQALLSFGTNNKPPAQDSRGINAFASLGIDSNPASAYYGTVYAAYPDFPSGTTSGANINIYLVKSTNGGASWSTPVKVNDDAGTATQIFPWLSIDQSDGSVNVSWYDSRIDPANNRKTQLFYARSSNGGASFEPNILVNDNGGVVWNNMIDYSNLNTTDNTSRNANQYGDYSGIAAINRKVIPFWTDSRSYFPNADTASPSRREDAASAIIVNCSAPSAPVALNSVINPNNTASVILNWGTSSDWGTNATDGTYSVYRATTPTLPANAVPIASSLTMPTFTDTTGTLTATYYYFVEAKNNCPGTALTPMSTVSTVSNAIVFPTGGSQVGTIQGNVTVNNQALSGVIISAGGAYSAVTDTNGFYQILGVPVASYTLTATATDYETNSASSISVNNGGTTVHNFALIPLSVQRAATDTTQSDFQAGTASSIDLTSAPGDLKLSLSGSEAVNQQNTSLGSSGNGITTTTWEAQTFTATASGKLTKLEAALFCSGCTGTTQPVTVEIRTVSGGLPTTTVLATTTIAAFSSGATAYYTATFANPATITAGTTYSFVLRMLANPSPGTYASTRSGSNVYAGGAWIQSTNSGASWTAQSQDLGFKVYITPATFATSGTFVSSVKDAAPVLGATTDWTNFSWNAITPANTSVKFQIAVSNNAAGPFNFVGPDGTASTFYTASGTLSPSTTVNVITAYRYFQYKAFLNTNDNLATPALNDVTIDYTNRPGNQCSIAGTVNYGIAVTGDPIKYVPDVLMSIAGLGNASVNTEAAGTYLLSDLTLGGNYIVTPSKTGNINGITAFDATLVLRCVAAGNNCALTANQRIAANTDGDANVTAFDATQILRYVAANGQNANTGQTGNWKFVDSSKTYNPLSASQTNQNYTAYLIGEVDGDWIP